MLYKTRKTIALLLLAAPAGLMTYVAASRPPDGLLLLMAPFLVGNLLAMVGLLLGKAWGRWLALAGAACGLVMVGTVGIKDGLEPWVLAPLAYFGAIIACLWGKRMVQRHEYHPRSMAPLTEPGWRARFLSRGAVLCMAALPLLWFLAMPAPYTAGSTAAVLAVTLIVAGILTLVLGRTASVLLLVAGVAVVLGGNLWSLTVGSPYSGRSDDMFRFMTIGMTLPAAALLLAATAGPIWRTLSTKHP
jgi:hypothetical protein